MQDNPAYQPPPKPDKLLGVRIVLLLATAVSAFFLPVMVAFFFGVAWLLSLVWPKS